MQVQSNTPTAVPRPTSKHTGEPQYPTFSENLEHGFLAPPPPLTRQGRLLDRGGGYKRVSNRPAYTPKHKSTWTYSYNNTLTPILILPAAYKPHALMDWNRKIMVPKRAQKSGNMGSPCLDKPVLGQGAQSSFPLQQYWCDLGMYSALVLVWYIPYVVRGQRSLLNVMKI